MPVEQVCKTVILDIFSSDSKITVGTNEAAAFWLKILLHSCCLGLCLSFVLRLPLFGAFGVQVWGMLLSTRLFC